MNENLRRAFEAAQQLPDEDQNILAEQILREIENHKQFPAAPLHEAMKAYREIKKRHDDLFRELAKL